MQKASSKSMSVIDVLKDDIVKLEGGKSTATNAFLDVLN